MCRVKACRVLWCDIQATGFGCTLSCGFEVMAHPPTAFIHKALQSTTKHYGAHLLTSQPTSPPTHRHPSTPIDTQRHTRQPRSHPRPRMYQTNPPTLAIQHRPAIPRGAELWPSSTDWAVPSSYLPPSLLPYHMAPLQTGGGLTTVLTRQY